MFSTRLTATAAAVALLSGAAFAQTPAPAPAAATPATQPTPPVDSGAVPALTPSVAPPRLAPAADIYSALKASPQFTVLTKALDDTGLSAVVKDQRYSITVFAPTDAAFAAMPEAERAKILGTDAASKTAMQGLLTYHLVNAVVDSSKIKGAKGPIRTVANIDLYVDGSGDALKVNNAVITQPDVRAGTGVIHVVSALLNPAYRPPVEPLLVEPTDPAAPVAN